MTFRRSDARPKRYRRCGGRAGRRCSSRGVVEHDELQRTEHGADQLVIRADDVDRVPSGRSWQFALKVMC